MYDHTNIVLCGMFGFNFLLFFSWWYIFHGFFALPKTYFFFVFAAIVPVSASATVSVDSMSNDYFEIRGFDARSLVFINDLSSHTAKVAERYLDKNLMVFSEPVIVSLRPNAYANFEGDYFIGIRARGGVELEVRWEDSISLEVTCYALTEALMKKYVIFNHGPKAMDSLRLWLLEALAQEVYLGLRPAMLSYFVDEARLRMTPELEVIIKSNVGDRPNESFNYGNWLLELIKSDAEDRRKIRSFLQQVIAGFDTRESLTKMLQTSDKVSKPLELDSWWRRGLAELLSRQNEFYETMKDSRIWLTSIAEFNQPIELDEGYKLMNLNNIWNLRNRLDVRELLIARRQVIYLRLASVNPAYYNSAHSLALLYEILLNDSQPYDYVRALANYLNDWEDATDMEEVINFSLNRQRYF